VHGSSQGKGMGASFTIALPLIEHSGAGNTDDMPAAEETREVALAGSLIVTVDDDPDTNALLKQVLEERGAVVRAFRSADEALEAVVQQTPDIIVSDIGLPGKDGYAFIREVRAFLGPRRDIAAIALTAFARREDRMKALDAGFSAHLSKPITPHTLVDAISRLLQKGSTPDGARPDTTSSPVMGY